MSGVLEERWGRRLGSAAWTRAGIAAVAVACAICWLPSRAEEPPCESVGVRWGVSAQTSSKRFTQTEAYATWNLPVEIGLGRGWGMQFQVDSSAGWLGGRGEDAFIGTAGPALKVGRERWPMTLVGGISATLMSRDSFGTEEFGMPFQFTSHVGLEFRILRHLDVGYRYQHMSNAGLTGANTGLNLHMLSLGYAF